MKEKAMYEETKKRSVTKAVIWRLIAVTNSFLILSWGITDDALSNAIMMNITGFLVYYFYERACNKVDAGKIGGDK